MGIVDNGAGGGAGGATVTIGLVSIMLTMDCCWMVFGLLIVDATGLLVNVTLPTSPRTPRMVPFVVLLVIEDC